MMVGIGRISVFVLAIGSVAPLQAAETPESSSEKKPTVTASSSSPAWPALQWKKGAPSPFARVETPTAVIDGKIYLFGGSMPGLGSSFEVDVYDPAADAWKRLKDMPTNCTHLNPAVDHGTIWFAGGFKGKHPGPVTAEVWKYDIASDSWSSGPALPEPRGGGGLVALDGKLHYVGGYKSDRDTNSGDHWTLAVDGGKSWEKQASLPDPRGHVTAAVLDGKIYALGGDHGHDITQIDVSSCHAFDPATNQWTAIAALPNGRSHFENSTIVRDGKIIIVGGRCNSSEPPRNVVSDILEYDPKTNAWRVLGNMPENLLAPSAAIISNQLIVTGGGLNNPQPLTDMTRIAPLPANAAEK